MRESGRAGQRVLHQWGRQAQGGDNDEDDDDDDYDAGDYDAGDDDDLHDDNDANDGGGDMGATIMMSARHITHPFLYG